jgi:tRNA(His) 5'-end guanylyltransferase
MENDDFGDRMKDFEQREAGRRFLSMLPICVRLDGKCFHNYTKGMERPYDKRLSDVMVAVTKFLVEETNACMGYVQSDEISLVLYSDSYNSQIYYDGKIAKIVSVVASLCTAKFNELAMKAGLSDKLAFFDCRAWQVPNLVEAANAFLWRELDSSKNSISMASRAYFSHKALMNKTGSEMQEMLFSQKGINWNDYPSFFKRGTFVQRRTTTKAFSAEELEKLPPKHQARQNPDLMVERSEVRVLDMPQFSKVTNRVEVIFNGAEPIVKTEEVDQKVNVTACLRLGIVPCP